MTHVNVKDVVGRVDPLTATCIASRLFLQTKVPQVAEVEVSKGVRKHWTKRREDIPLIRVVTMRESEREDATKVGDSRHVEWSHRWLVRPHWRRQAVGPDKSERRPTFINTHIKGPEEKPLVVKQTIFNAVR